MTNPDIKNPRAKHDFVGRTCSISAVGSYVPEKVLTNADLEKLVDTTDEWITTRTGIKERRIAADDEYTSDMATRAAQRALAAGIPLVIDGDSLRLIPPSATRFVREWDDNILTPHEGELQALEGAARSLWDFPDAPWEFKMNMARQCWDEARHIQIFEKLLIHQTVSILE